MNEQLKAALAQIHALPKHSTNGFDSELFKQQGKILSDCTDDYEGRAYFFKTYPYYDCMSEEQLRSYISWRTKWRNGKISRIKRSYMHLYIYELIYSIGVKDADEGFQKLVEFWRAYSKYTYSFDEQMKYVFEHYYIISRPKQSFAQLIARYDLEYLFDDAAAYETGINYFELEQYANYRFIDSAIYSMKHVPMVSKCFDRILKNLMPIFELYCMDIRKVFGYRDVGTEEFLPFDGVIYTESSETNAETGLSGCPFYEGNSG